MVELIIVAIVFFYIGYFVSLWQKMKEVKKKGERKMIKETNKQLKKYKEKDLLVGRPSQLWENKVSKENYILSLILYIQKTAENGKK